MEKEIVSMENEIVLPEDGLCVRNLEDEVPVGSSNQINRYSTPPPISSQQVNKSMETDIPTESNGFTYGVKNNELDPCPVSPCASGEGLPYAPVDWPNSGDIWSWKVGKRISKSGFYADRYLFLPSRLWESRHKTACFSSKCALRAYIKTVDPEIDIAAFFKSFNWRVPPKKVTSRITPPVCSHSGKKVSQEEEEKIRHTLPRRKRKAAKLPLTSVYRRRTRQSTKWTPQVKAHDTGIICLSSLSEESETSEPTNQQFSRATDLEPDQVSSHQTTVSPATGLESDQVSSRQAPISPAGSFVTYRNTHVSSGIPQMELNQGPKDSKVIPKGFDNYINSLDDMLARPLPQGALSLAAADNYQDSNDKFAEARSKLSSILGLDFHLLLSSQNLEEPALLASKLLEDPGLSAEQLSKLKLIEELPVTAKDFLETTQIMEKVDKLFSGLASNIDKATSLRSAYTASKEDIAMLQANVNCSLLKIEEIDDQIAEYQDQIAKLQSRRAELSTDIEIKNEEVTNLTITQAMVADSLPKVVHEVQLANTEKPEWEQMKKNALKREAEILNKIAPLRGFSL